MSTSYLRNSILSLEKQTLKRELRLVNGSQGPKITVDGKKVLNFCSNNYLGLADDPRLANAALACMKEQGFGSGASRLVCGHMEAHERLERQIAEFKGAESCLVFSTGYMANVGIISALFGRDDVIFSDRLNHASIVDGIRLSQAKMKRYGHCDMKALEEKLKTSDGYSRRCIITDSVFSMDGDIAPLDEIVALAKRYDCMVMIDEAHALGVMGKTGKGLAEHFHLGDEIDIQMGTLSKAAGSFGAYCCGSNELISFLVNKARSFIYTTAMPPAVAAASQEAMKILDHDTSLREKLWENTRFLIGHLKLMGFDIGSAQTPIIPIMVHNAQTALEFSKRLWDGGIMLSAIRPPTVPLNTSRLRLTVMATHTREDLEHLLDQLQRVGKDLCLI